MQWTNTSGSPVDLTHLKDMGTFATGGGLIFYTPQLITSVQGSSYLITVEAADTGTAYVTLIVEHLDPSGNVVWSQKLMCVHATFGDGPTVVKGPCYAADIRVTVGVGNSSDIDPPTDAIVRVYSSPHNQQQRPTRVVGSGFENSSVSDSVLAYFTGNVAASTTVGPFPLLPYAGLATLCIDFPTQPVTIRASIEADDAEGNGFARVGITSNGVDTISLPAATNLLTIRNTSLLAVNGVSVSVIANDYTL